MLMPEEMAMAAGLTDWRTNRVFVREDGRAVVSHRDDPASELIKWKSRNINHYAALFR